MVVCIIARRDQNVVSEPMYTDPAVRQIIMHNERDLLRSQGSTEASIPSVVNKDTVNSE